MSKTSAIDAIQPAIELTKQRLFNPARYSMWWRIALLGVFSGELSGGGGNFHGGGGIPSHATHSHHFARPEIGTIIVAALMIMAVSLVLLLLFTYIASILRFVLFDAVLTGRHHIRAGWRMWRERALPYFRLQILIFFGLFAGLLILVGVPCGVLYRNGVFASHHWTPENVFLAVVAGLLAVAWIITVALFVTLSKDFVLPMMALEGLDYDEGWQRFRAMLLAQKKDYAIYILMKIVLSMAGSILLAIAFFLCLLVFGIPIGLLSAVAYFGMHITLATIGGKLLLALAVFVLIFLTVSAGTLLSAPLSVFFPAYSIYFFASRYEPLHQALYPPAPPEAPPISPEPSPAI
jgi:hypothetical protein